MNACICCKAALLCASGASKVYLMNLEVLYIYMPGMEITSGACIEGKATGRCWKMQALLEGRWMSREDGVEVLSMERRHIRQLRNRQRLQPRPASREATRALASLAPPGFAPGRFTK